jgi:hypothetical protein
LRDFQLSKCGNPECGVKFLFVHQEIVYPQFLDLREMIFLSGKAYRAKNHILSMGRKMKVIQNKPLK